MKLDWDVPFTVRNLLDTECKGMEAVFFASMTPEQQFKFRQKEQQIQLLMKQAALANVAAEQARKAEKEKEQETRQKDMEAQHEARRERERKEADRRASLTQEARDKEDRRAALLPLWQRYEHNTRHAVFKPEDLEEFERPPPFEGFPSADRPELHAGFKWPGEEVMKAKRDAYEEEMGEKAVERVWREKQDDMPPHKPLPSRGKSLRRSFWSQTIHCPSRGSCTV